MLEPDEAHIYMSYLSVVIAGGDPAPQVGTGSSTVSFVEQIFTNAETRELLEDKADTPVAFNFATQ